MTSPAAVDLHCLIRTELEERHWGIRQLSLAVGVQFGVAARWVARDPAKRVVPKPETLVRLARELDLDVYEVFRRAGYLPLVDNSNHPHEAEIKVLLQRLRRILRSVPEGEWAIATIVVATQLENIQLLLDRLDTP